MKLFIATPHARNIVPEHTASIMQTTNTFRLLQGLGLEILQHECNMVSFGRDYLQQLACEYGADKVLFIDSDITFSPEDITMMLDTGKLIIGGLYVSRTPPLRYHAYEMIDPENKEDKYGVFKVINKIAHEPFICDAVGAGFLMIDRYVINQMRDPVFVAKYGWPFNLWQRPNGNQIGEDMSFCLRARELGHQIWCDPRVNLGHIGIKKYTQLDHFMSRGFYYCNDIQGWMSPAELQWLYHTAKSMESIIELGCWKGRSTHALASGCYGNVIAIDHFKGSAEETTGPHAEARTTDVEAEFMKNVGSKFKNVLLMNEPIEQIRKLPQADMIFIDASHKYEDVKRDIALCRPYAKKILCGHDYNWPEVNKAVDEMIGINRIQVVDSIWIHRMEN